MRTIAEEFSDSDDDWFGFASAQDRKDGHSLRAYLLRYADRIPEHHVVVKVELVLRTEHPPRGIRPPYLCVVHFDPGHLTNVPLTWKRNIEDLKFDSTITYVECGYDIFESFSDAKMHLTARGCYLEPLN
ncbi:hypothetical protein [Burkholderia vietnamiensis]|uniref:hypothetical protein n=1 Tax=Burkholderia vietnamiensis TaxID=60552 RepID=UPI00076D2B91|nr:hypothetical protein [Burkholderia vietnamiensis]KVF26304.1 hypothetical protein WJ07_08625 [Burkholderia vietnamiensis]